MAITMTIDLALGLHYERTRRTKRWPLVKQKGVCDVRIGYILWKWHLPFYCLMSTDEVEMVGSGLLSFLREKTDEGSILVEFLYILLY